MNKILLVCLAIGIAVARPAAADDVAVFNKANQAYKAGDYAGALSGYGEISKHLANPGLYLNLGNAAYKAGKTGQAILAYERGLKLDPRSADLEANLRFAREHITDKSGDETTWLGHTISVVYHFLSLRELVIATSILWFLTLAVAAVLCWLDVPLGRTVSALFSVLDGKESKLPALFIPCAAVLSLFGGWTATRLHEESAPHAIVLEKEVRATSGPGADPTVVFAVHEGTKVQVVRRSEHWAQVVLGNGYSGWVPEESIGEI